MKISDEKKEEAFLLFMEGKDSIKKISEKMNISYGCLAGIFTEKFKERKNKKMKDRKKKTDDIFQIYEDVMQKKCKNDFISKTLASL